MTAKLRIAVTKESVGRQIFSKRICNHIARCAVNQDNVSSTDTVTQGVDPEVNVFANPSKTAMIFHALEKRAVDICVLTETHWSFATGDWFLRDEAWLTSRVNFNNKSYSAEPLNKLQRGCVCLLVNRGLNATITTLRHQDGPLTLAQWRITCSEWDHNLVVTGVYRSPNTTDTAPLDTQFTQIEAYMCQPKAHPNQKYDVLLAMGDFNAKIGEDKSPAQGLPPRRGFSGICLAGKALLLSMKNLDWIPLNNRTSSPLVPTEKQYSNRILNP